MLTRSQTCKEESYIKRIDFKEIESCLSNFRPCSDNAYEDFEYEAYKNSESQPDKNDLSQEIDSDIDEGN